jgi:hypothetical protein
VRRTIAALCLASTLAACGIDTQSDAHVFDDSEVPFGLTDPAPTTTTPANIGPTTAASVSFEVYFIRSNILVPVTRQAGMPPTATDLVTALLNGPTQSETTTNHRNALAGLEITARPRDASSVTVDLGRTFNDISRTNDRIFALGQLTLTLTDRPGISLVQYTIADSPIEVPKANGTLTKEPVSRSDYAALLQAPTASASTSTSTSTAPSTTAPTSSPATSG